MSLKLLPLVAALTLAGAANAITVNISDFNFGAPVDAKITGTDGSPSYDNVAGAFRGTLTDTPPVDANRSSLAAASPTSFVAWCVELTQNFSFGVSYDYALVDGSTYTFGGLLSDPNSHRLADLSRLFTEAAAKSFVFDSAGSAAFQAGIWEIVYERDPLAGYGFGTGTLRGAASDPVNQAAFNTIDGYLQHLGDYVPAYHIDVLTNGDQQDFLVASVPEPETWAMLVGGLGMIGLLRRRRKA